MKTGDMVFILPTRSLRFGGRWGVITNIDPTQDLSISITFGGGDYKFDPQEILSLEEYRTWFQENKPAIYNLTGEKVIILYLREQEAETTEGCIPLTDLSPITICRVCGQELFGQFTSTCEDCLHPVQYQP